MAHVRLTGKGCRVGIGRLKLLGPGVGGRKVGSVSNLWLVHPHGANSVIRASRTLGFVDRLQKLVGTKGLFKAHRVRRVVFGEVGWVCRHQNHRQFRMPGYRPLDQFATKARLTCEHIGDQDVQVFKLYKFFGRIKVLRSLKSQQVIIRPFGKDVFERLTHHLILVNH